MYNNSTARLSNNDNREEKCKNDSVDSTDSIGIAAMLKSDFTYSKFGVEVTLEAGTLIYVDEKNLIASHGDDLFTIESNDYQVFLLN